MYFSLGPSPISGSFQGLRELFSIPFPKDRTIHRKTFDLLRLAWGNCSSDFSPLQATLNTTTAASQLWAQQLSHPAGERRKTFGGLVIPKGNGNPWRKVWETRIQWGEFCQWQA
jgi:hypothetical protein